MRRAAESETAAAGQQQSVGTDPGDGGGEAQQLTCGRGRGSQTRGQFKSVMTDLAIAIHLNAADYHNNTRELGTGGTSTSTRCGSGVSRVQIFIYSYYSIGHIAHLFTV